VHDCRTLIGFLPLNRTIGLHATFRLVLDQHLHYSRSPFSLDNTSSNLVRMEPRARAGKNVGKMTFSHAERASSPFLLSLSFPQL
jgi:hypothetical protein